MKKANLILAVLLCCAMSVNAQMKVYSDGSATFNSYCGNWGKALATTVNSPKACAYHLNYNNEDVFYVCAEGWIWCKKGGYFGSDYKLKKNIHKIHSPLATIQELHGVQYDYTDTAYNSKFEDYKYSKLKDPQVNKQRMGLIAQEVEAVLPAVVRTLDDSTMAISYTDIIALLVEAVKEQQILFAAQSQKIKELEKAIESGNGKIRDPHANKKMLAPTAEDNEAEITVEESAAANAFLYQNTPNPFSSETEIRYFLPENAINAVLYVFSLNGNMLLSKPLTQKGNGSVTISSTELEAGMYIYTLAIDGVEVDSKRMILTEK